MGFQRTIPAFEQAKTVHALDRAATVIGKFIFTLWRELCSFLAFLSLSRQFRSLKKYETYSEAEA
jgi:hypothetical protein